MVNISFKIRISILLLHEKEKLNIVANILISETKTHYSILREGDENLPGAWRWGHQPRCNRNAVHKVIMMTETILMMIKHGTWAKVVPIPNVMGLKWWPVDNADQFAGITIHLLTLSPSRHDRYPWLRCCFAPMFEIRFREYHQNIFAFFCVLN